MQISFSTIGLGDIVPDNPRYMVMNFWLVLIGLSLVSMTISIIQSKIEEFLFRVMKRIREEYNKLIGAVEAEQDETGEGEVTEGQKRLVMDKVWDSQPWYVKSFLPKVLNERQKEVLEDHNNIVAFVITHSKKIQTDTNWDSFEYQHDPTDLNSGGQHFHSQHQPSADVCIQVAFQEDDLLEMQVEQCHVGAQTAQLDFVSQICQTDTLATFTAEIQLQTEPIGMRDESQQTGVFVGGILRSLSRKSETSRVSFVSDYSQPSTPANGSVAIRDFDTVSWNSVASVPTMAHNSVDSRGLKRQKAFHHSDSNESFNQQPGKVVVRKAHTIVNIPCSDTQDSLLYPVYKSIYKSKSVPMAIIAENGNCRYYANDSFSAEEPQLSITVVPESESTSTDDIFVDAQSDFPQINSIPNISFFPTESINIFNVTDETGNAGHNSTLLNTLNSRKLSNGDLVRNAEFSAEDNQAQIDSEFSDTTKLLPQAIRKLSQSGPVRKLSQQLRKPSLLEVNGQMVVANINGDLMTVGETPRETSFEPVRKLSRAGERKLSCSHRPPVITDDCGVQTDCPRDMGLIRDRSINVSNEISDRSSQTEEKSVREMATNTVKIKKLSPPTTAVKFDVDIQTEPHASDMVDRSIQTKDSWLRIANRINTYQSNRAPSLMISRAPMIKRSLPDPIQPAIVEEEESN